jgi:hypothetical protein
MSKTHYSTLLYSFDTLVSNFFLVFGFATAFSGIGDHILPARPNRQLCNHSLFTDFDAGEHYYSIGFIIDHWSMEPCMPRQ